MRAFVAVVCWDALCFYIKTYRMCFYIETYCRGIGCVFVFRRIGCVFNNDSLYFDVLDVCLY